MVREGMEARAAAALAARLWPENDVEELTDEFRALMASPDAAVFGSEEGGAWVGFAQCQLRRDYVEGTDSSPVGYLEGILVLPEYRGRGHGRALLAACEAWARARGCREFASDCELTNEESQLFHQSVGFEEANRIVCYVKQL